MAKNIQNKETKGRSFLKVLIAIGVPMIFLLTITFIILTLMGVNVVKETEKIAQKMPVISSILPSEETTASSTEEYDRLQAVIANQEAEIEQLKQEADNKDAKIEEKDQQLMQLEADLKEKNSSEETTEENETAQVLAASFEEMDAEQAAPILENMTKEQAVLVLNEIASEERGDILGQMEAEAAAEMAGLLLIN
ncbi:magnesium transporter MgtE N-terminal domain-containing protein [Halobacillus litoralis]|uniref:magnesium transporter MgtE N-terminal domain-containing protein n=1 Tax=Halobacillus litoralis TaxID=45668 RepID=UPI001CFDC0A8|nr:hypothetical protein [Halobacillus litoralis]